ncbi:MAG: hypothetical protein PF637_04755 [Spirochaetes bacterium]|jgi:hypothetical protein|nr:hypothetical protein [Spirochaetota bacterium]
MNKTEIKVPILLPFFKSVIISVEETIIAVIVIGAENSFSLR